MLDAKTSPATHAVIGALIEVHKEFGRGFLEKVYHDAVCMEFDARRIPYQHEAPAVIYYKGRPLRRPYYMDFVCFGHILVEIKAQVSIGDVKAAQVIHYLKASRLPIGILANFGEDSLRIQRFVGATFRPDLAASVQSVESVVGERN